MTQPFAGEIKMAKVIKDGQEVIEWEPVSIEREKQEAALRELAEIDRELGIDYMQADVDGVTMSEEHVHKSDKSKHEWVGLTDEERRDIREWQEIQKELGPVWAPMMLYLYVAIEAKLKEKNT